MRWLDGITDSMDMDVSLFCCFSIFVAGDWNYISDDSMTEFPVRFYMLVNRMPIIS